MFERVKQKALEYGFTEAAVMDAKDLVFIPEYRMFCEENRCGNYGRNYACPPYCGTVEQMKEKTQKYRYVLVLETSIQVDDALDGSETTPLKKDHTGRSRAFIREMKQEGLLGEGLSIMAGPCDVCKECMMPYQKPCPHPEQRASCLSAYSIDVGKLAEAAGMSFSWDMDQVSFFSMYLTNGGKEADGET